MIYCIEQDGGKPVKIGRSQTPQDRLRALQTGSPAPLHIVWATTVADSAAAEKWLHDRFATQRLDGEWFAMQAPTPNVVLGMPDEVLKCPCGHCGGLPKSYVRDDGIGRAECRCGISGPWALNAVASIDLWNRIWV